MKRFILSLSLILSIGISAHESNMLVAKNVATSTNEVGSGTLLYTKNGYFVAQDGNLFPIQRYNMDKLSRTLNTVQLEKFVEVGYFRVGKLDNGEFTLKAFPRGLGGGPGAAFVGYWGTKAIAYLAPVAAASLVAPGGGTASVATALYMGTATGGTAAYIAATESAATGVAWALLACPFLP